MLLMKGRYDRSFCWYCWNREQGSDGYPIDHECINSYTFLTRNVVANTMASTMRVLVHGTILFQSVWVRIIEDDDINGRQMRNRNAWEEESCEGWEGHLHTYWDCSIPSSTGTLRTERLLQTWK